MKSSVEQFLLGMTIIILKGKIFMYMYVTIIIEGQKAINLSVGTDENALKDGGLEGLEKV